MYCTAISLLYERENNDIYLVAGLQTKLTFVVYDVALNPCIPNLILSFFYFCFYWYLCLK